MAEKTSMNLPGKVQKIVESPDQPEKAQIALEKADDLYREIRIENSLTDENGNKVALKKGAEVEVTVEADKDATIPKEDDKE